MAAVTVACLTVLAGCVTTGGVGGDLPGARPGTTEVGDNSAVAGDNGSLDGDLGERTVAVDDEREPAVSGLDPALAAALRTAAAAAAGDGITVRVTSGWRSPAFQQRLLDEAVERYGSLDEARRWVSTPTASHHVRGDAVDIGPTDAAYWFDQHGADYGLCRAYSNEIWHYELRTHPGGSCPPLAPDAAA